MPTDPLDPILEQAGVKESCLQQAELTAISRNVSMVSAEEFIEACTYAPGLSWDDGQIRPAGRFEIHNRSWWIDVTDAGNRRYLLVIITAAMLVDALRLDLSTRWVAQIWPSVLGLRSVTRDEAGLHLDLARRATTPLPPQFADDVHPADYAEFAAAIEGAAAVVLTQTGSRVTFTGP